MLTDPSLVRFSVGLYRALLGAYPPQFRREYGGLMVQVFRDSCLSAARGSPGAVSGLWLRTLADYFISLVEQHARGGADMTRSKWIKTSGWLMAGAGLLMMFAWLAGSRPEYNPYNAAAWPVDRFLNQASRPAMIVGAVFLLLGLAGLQSRFAQRAGGLGRAGLWTSLVGNVVMLVGLVGQFFTDSSPWWETLMIGITAMFAGMALFGIACLRLRLFPRWNILPLLSALPWLVAIIVELAAAAVRQPYDIPEIGIAAVFLVSFISLALTGYRLQADTSAGMQGEVTPA